MNSPKLMEGPRELWHYVGIDRFEWGNETYTKPIFLRAAYRKGEPADGFTQLRDQIADWFDSLHPLDFYPVRALRRFGRSINYHLFGAGEHREVEWITGVVLATCVVTVVFRMLAHR